MRRKIARKPIPINRILSIRTDLSALRADIRTVRVKVSKMEPESRKSVFNQ
jgi:hypothetical protein